jgi:hypothetical protein
MIGRIISILTGEMEKGDDFLGFAQLVVSFTDFLSVLPDLGREAQIYPDVI